MTREPDRWWDHANCQGVDLETFYPAGGRGSQIAILEYCVGCPVRQNCLQDALATPYEDDFGIWGGTTRAERGRMRKGQRKPARIANCAWCGDEFRTGLPNAKYCRKHQTSRPHPTDAEVAA